jgi:membrane-bound ClpP family serine protease
MDKPTEKPMTPEERALQRKSAANLVGQSLGADVLLYNGPIMRPIDMAFHSVCRTREHKAKNVVLLLITEGGDPDAAYRMSRGLQEHYERFSCLVPGWCKSAGTLIAVGAHDLIFTGTGELGPLDVQMSKRDDLIEMQSGQTVVAALTRISHAE